MENVTSKIWYSLFLRTVIVAAIALSSACTSQKSISDNPVTKDQAEAKAVVSSAESEKILESENDQSSAPIAESQTQTAVAKTNLDAVPVIVEPVREVESCKKEPYIKFEVQARESIKKGWEATKADKYGVGFRDADEYKKWSATYNIVYKKVSTACEELSKCAKKNDKVRDKKCEQQAKRYSRWQKTAELFANKIKLAETQQPPKLCSINPSADDLSNCYEKVADNIDKVCSSEQCQEVSMCWRGIAFLDGAIRQAEQSCGFVHQKLSNCTAYTESTGRRKAEFKSCDSLYGALDIEVQPAL